MADTIKADMSDNLYSQREEDKYLGQRKDLDDIIGELEYYLDPFYMIKGTDYVNISSTYFDNDELKFLQDHLNEIPDRYKVRLRQYSPNGKLGDEKYFEVKYREDGIKKKVRLAVTAVPLAVIIGGGGVPEYVRKDNKDIPKDEYNKAVQVIEKVCKNGLTPILQVNYTRVSYKGDDVRVTIDKDVKTQGFATLKSFDLDTLLTSGKYSDFEKIGNMYSPSKNIVIEVKHELNTEAPKWLKKVLDKYTDGEDKAFSKYVYALYQELS